MHVVQGCSNIHSPNSPPNSQNINRSFRVLEESKDRKSSEKSSTPIRDSADDTCENGHPTITFANNGNDMSEPDDGLPVLRQQIFRGSTVATEGQMSHHLVHRSQTFDSSFIIQRHPSTPSRLHSSSYGTSPIRSPTFPFRPNTALRSYQMTQVHTSSSFDEQMQSAMKNMSVMSHSSSDEISIVAEEANHQQYFPVNPSPIESGNWWLDEIIEISRQMYPQSSRALAGAAGEYIEHIVLPTDTLQGICLAYKVSAMRLKKENGFSGNNLQLGPKKLRIPVNTNYGMSLQRKTPDSGTVPSKNVSGVQNNTSQTSPKTDSDIPDQQSTILNQFNDDKSHYSKDDMLILHDIMDKLKEEMKRADDLDPEKKSELEQLLKRLESTMAQDDMWKVTKSSNIAAADNPVGDTYDSLRKPLVAAAGGTLVTAGAILVPVPIIPGALVIYAGLSVLATEFEVASQALDKMKEPLKEILAHEEDAVAHKESNEIDVDLTLWSDLIPSSENLHLHESDIDKEFVSLMQVRADPNSVDEFDDAARKAKNEMKRWARNLLNLDPVESEETCPVVDTSPSSPSTKQSLLKRFDSLLSSYGEEVDEDGIASDRVL